MEKYKNEAERQIAQAKAVDEIREFMNTQMSYTELLQCHSEAQLAVADVEMMVDEGRRPEIMRGDIYSFFYYTLQLIKLMEPFTEEKLYI